MPVTRPTLLAVLATLALGSGLAACGGSADDAAPAAAPAASSEAAMTEAAESAMTEGTAAISAMTEATTGGGDALELRPTQFGDAIFTAAGGALYLFDADQGSTSTCYDACATAWPPLVVTAAPTVGAGLDEALVGTTTRTDGTLQATYAGHPLYLFQGDEPGEVACQHADMNGGLWLILNADGTPNMSEDPSHMAMTDEAMTDKAMTDEAMTDAAMTEATTG